MPAQLGAADVNVAHWGQVAALPAGWQPGTPRQLPPVPAGFVSRAGELADLDDLIEAVGSRQSEQASVRVIVGPGGVGKTALAVTWASRRAKQFPDGQLYVDLRGFSAGAAVLPGEVLASFLRALGVDTERVPVELAELTGLFRTVTAGRRLLLVLDNAASAAQVRPLIPASADCAVVVTSRLRLDALFGDGAQFIELAPLPQREAVRLLDRAVGAVRARKESAAISELAKLCGWFPITLRVVAAQLAARPRWPVSRVVEELRDERRRLTNLSRLTGADDSVAATFDWSYRALPPRVAGVYRGMTECSIPEFGVGVAAAVAEMADHDAALALQELVDASLLEEIELDRFRFHDLIRLHGRAQPDDHRFEVSARAARWYLRELTRANLVVIPMRWRVGPAAEQLSGESARFGSGSEALEWLTAELPNVMAVLEDAVADRHDELAWQLCEALWELMLYRKHYPEWLRSHELGIRAAQRCGNRVAESRLRYQLGRAYLDLGQLGPAESETRQAVELARAAEDRRNESAALEQLGMVAQSRGEVDTAVMLFSDTLHIEQELGIERGVAARHRRIGEALLQVGRETEAAGHLGAAQQLFSEIGDDKGQARVALGLARIDARSGRPETALRRLRQAREVLGQSGSAVYEAEVLMTLAEVARGDEQEKTVRAYLAEAVALLDDVGGVALQRALAALEALDGEDDSELAQPPGNQPRAGADGALRGDAEDGRGVTDQ
ncbi:ATP-binding protein [Amycolatopsis sp. cmx-4-61]|uniref:ATP-binding protein n=1 Tax=Amycolatopsis sp. cmx-4-61 TaxID=2790937 RepID=UPI0039795825